MLKQPKKLLSVFIALAMCVQMLPVTSFATEAEPQTAQEIIGVSALPDEVATQQIEVGSESEPNLPQTITAAIKTEIEVTPTECTHHSDHTEQCGYAPAVLAVECDKECAATEGETAHAEDCAFTAGAEETLCGFDPATCEECANADSQPTEPTTEEVEVPVTWAPPEGETFSTAEVKDFTYTASITDATYTLASGVTLPNITVNVVAVADNAPPECDCETKCTTADEENDVAESINPDCLVCSVEGADLSECNGAVAMLMMTPPTRATNVPTIDGNNIYANGTAITIEAGTSDTKHTKIKYHDGTNDVYLDLGGGAEEADLSAYTIYGGAKDTPVTSTSITMTGGTVSNVCGGGNTAGATVEQNTNVNVSGGTIHINVFGGGNDGEVEGSTDVNVSGGTINNVYGGGQDGNVTGSTNVTVNGGTVQNVFGGGFDSSTTVNSTNVTVSGTAEIGDSVYGGGFLSAVEGSTDVTVSGTAEITKNVYGGGNAGAVTGSTNVTISDTATISGSVYGGGQEGKAPVGETTNVEINGTATINGSVYGGGQDGNVTGSKNGYVALNGKADAGTFDNQLYKSGATTWAMVGNYTLNTDMTIASGETLTVPVGQTLTISSGVTVTNNDTILNNGTIINNGTITNNGIIDGTGTITGNSVEEPEDEPWNGGWNGDENGPGLGEGIGFNGTNSLKVTLPYSGKVTYGTITDNTIAQTARNQATLPESGWNWAVDYTDTSKDPKLILNNMTVNNTAGKDIVMISRQLSEIELRGNNVINGTAGTALSGDIDVVFTIIGAGNLTVGGEGIDRGISNSGNILLNNTGTITITVESQGISSNSNVTINSGTIDITTSDDGNAGFEDMAFWVWNSISINGGKVTAKSRDGVAPFKVEPTLGTGVTHSGGAWDNLTGEACVYESETITPPPTKHTVTVNQNGGNGTPSGAGTYAVGDTVTIKAGTKSGYSFNGWTASGVTLANPNSNETTFTMPTNAVTVTANWSRNSSGGGGGGGGGSYTPSPKPDEEIKGSVNTAKDTATFKTTEKNLNSLIRENKDLTLTSSLLDIRFDTESLKVIGKQTSGDVNVSAVKKSDLSQANQTLIGNRPVYNITVKGNNNKTVSDFEDGYATVYIPYKLQPGEQAENLVVYYIDANGKATVVGNFSYDAKTGRMMFKTNHFSIFGIGYKNPVKFTDLTGHWAEEDIYFTVNRGLFSGTTATTFSPNTSMTRGMFVTALGRLAEVNTASYKTTKFTDVKSTDYFAPYVAWANAEGIVNGTSDTTFSPNQSITREQMAGMLYNYSKEIGFTLSKAHKETTFADRSSISTWAKTAVKEIQMAGILAGKSDNKFDPQGIATRAEVSVMLKRFIEISISESRENGFLKNDSGEWM